MKSMIKSYKELIVWQRSIELVKEIYITTSQFPKEELTVFLAKCDVLLYPFPLI